MHKFKNLLKFITSVKLLSDSLKIHMHYPLFLYLADELHVFVHEITHTQGFLWFTLNTFRKFPRIFGLPANLFRPRVAGDWKIL